MQERQEVWKAALKTTQESTHAALQVLRREHARLGEHELEHGIIGCFLPVDQVFHLRLKRLPKKELTAKLQPGRTRIQYMDSSRASSRWFSPSYTCFSSFLSHVWCFLESQKATRGGHVTPSLLSETLNRLVNKLMPQAESVINAVSTRPISLQSELEERYRWARPRQEEACLWEKTGTKAWQHTSYISISVSI